MIAPNSLTAALQLTTCLDYRLVSRTTATLTSRIWSGSQSGLREINPSHFHPAPHGMYVLRGSLVTHRGTFGPDTYVWFPPHEVMWHGAASDQELVVLFIAGPNLSTHYTKRPEAPSERSPSE